LTFDKFPLLQEIMMTHQAVLVADTQTDPRWRSSPPFSWIRSHIKAPLLVQDELIGFLNLDSADPHTFTEYHRKHIQQFANHAATALQSAWQHTQEREQLRFNAALRETARLVNSTLELEAIIAQMLESLKDAMQPEALNVLLATDGVTSTVGSIGYGEDAAWLDQLHVNVSDFPNYVITAQTGQPILIHDADQDDNWIDLPETRWVRSHITACIQFNSRVLGYLNIESSVPHAFNERQAAWVQAFADQAAIAIRNAQLYQAEREQRHLNKALYQTTAALNSTKQLDEIFHILLTNVRKVIPADAANVMQVEADIIKIVAAQGYEAFDLGDWIQHLSLPLSDMPDFERAIAAKSAHIIEDTHTAPFWLGLPETSWTRSHLKAPLVVDNEVIGFLCLDSSHPNFFTEKHMRWIRTFADQTATAIKNANVYAQLEEERARLEAILNATSEGIIYIEDTRIRYVNAPMLTMTGHTEADLVGRSLRRLATFDDPPYELVRDEAIRHLTQRGSYSRRELELKRQDGAVLKVAAHVTLINKPTERPVRAVIVVRDIGQEQALEYRQSRFITHAAHELRQPLASLVTRLYILRRKPETLPESLEKMEVVTERMTHIIEDMLEVSQFDRGEIMMQMQRTPLQPLIQKAVKESLPLAEELGLELVCDLPTDSISTEVDLKHFTELVSTLLLNAISISTTRVTLSLERVDAGETAYALLSVKDTSASLTMEQVDHFFQPFHHPSAGNIIRTGLELTIAQYIVRQHNGLIEVIKNPDDSNTICVRLKIG
jgi:PAS domain S-box-containing protein